MVSNSDKALIKSLNNIFDEHKSTLKKKIDERKIEIKNEDNIHWELYSLLGNFNKSESFNMDFYQNVGRFFFKYAGSMLEEMVLKIFNDKKNAEKIYLENTISSNPKKFEIDCFVKEDNKGHEIKWRDATTDGDHKKKEETKLKQMEKNGIIPVKIMFYMPEREQAKKIQTNIIKLYEKKGFSYVGIEAWKYVKNYGGFDLRKFLFKKDF
jgi:hypothetical protein